MNNACSIETPGPGPVVPALRLAVLVAALGLLAACATAPESEPANDNVVVLQAFEVLDDGGGAQRGCRAGWFYIYPPDIAPHARVVRYDVVGSSMLSGGGPLPLPRPARDPRPQQREDGLMEMKVNIASFGPCLNRNGERIIEFTIGECVEGDCPPMRLEIPDDAELVEFRLVED